MNLISKHTTKLGDITFYEGIDFDYAKSYDGKSGIIVFLIDNWVNEVNSWKRNKKIESILEDVELNHDHNINNNYVMIYQVRQDLEKIYNILLDKFNIY